MATNSKGLALAGVGTGVLLLWSGLKGAQVSAVLKEILLGQKPAGTDVNPTGAAKLVSDIQGSSSVSSSSSANTSSASVPQTTDNIADVAEQYNGERYVWGASGPTTFDCSGLVNYVCGHDLRLPIPGSSSGNYSGHGPVTQAWYVWNGLTTVPSDEMQAGDIVCWLTHMGIAVSSSELISALDTASGVCITTVAGASPGGPVRIRRYA